MSYQKDRERFHLEAGRLGLSEYTVGKLLRYASTLQRLAVAQCNGDWPADNGQRRTLECPRCGSSFAPSSMRYTTQPDPNEARPAYVLDPQSPRYKICPDCRTAELIRACLDEHNRIAMGSEGERLCFEARIEGDPRGYVLRLIPRGTSDEDYQSGRVRPVYVPGRER